MKQIQNFIIVIIISAIILSCDTKVNIIGKWERYGDSKAGALVKIEKFGDNYQGVLLNLVGENEQSGWTIGDVCWKNITLIEKNKYKAIAIGKGLQNGVSQIVECDIIITLKGNGILFVRNFVTDNTFIGEGKERKYERIK